MMGTGQRGKDSAEVKNRERVKEEQHHPKAQGCEQGKGDWCLRHGESELPGETETVFFGSGESDMT